MFRLTRSDYQPFLDLMNMHAKIAASKHRRGSPEFYKLFETFIQLLVVSGYGDGYLDGDATDLSRAYWAFLDCLGTEVTAVSEDE